MRGLQRRDAVGAEGVDCERNVSASSVAVKMMCVVRRFMTSMPFDGDRRIVHARVQRR